MDIRKVAIIGCGMVGATTAFALMESGLFTDIILIDVDRDRAVGEAMDLSHCLPYVKPVDIRAGDYPDLADCGIIIVTAGVPQKEGETRLDCITKNVEVFKTVIPKITLYNTRGILLVVSNPVDILSYVAYKLSGFDSSRVFGSGTVLDTARLRFILGRRLCVAPSSVHAFVIGEHGDSELAAWSGATVGGVELADYCTYKGYTRHAENRRKIESQVKSSAYDIIERKRATYYGIAVATRRICESIVRDERAILPVSTLVDGHYGLDGLYISVPALVGTDGISDVPDAALSDEELSALKSSAETLKGVIKQIGF